MYQALKKIFSVEILTFFLETPFRENVKRLTQSNKILLNRIFLRKCLLPQDYKNTISDYREEKV